MPRQAAEQAPDESAEARPNLRKHVEEEEQNANQTEGASQETPNEEPVLSEVALKAGDPFSSFCRPELSNHHPLGMLASYSKDVTMGDEDLWAV